MSKHKNKLMYDFIMQNIRVIDGDSIEATLDRGMNDYSVKTMRY